MLQLLRGVSEDGSCPARLVIHVDERLALDAVVALPLDGEVSVGLFDVDGFGIPIPCQGRGEPILLIEQPGIPRLRREQDKLPDRNDSSVVSGCTPSNVAYLIGETEILDVLHALARSTPNGSSGGGHGTLHQAVRRSSRLRLSLLRSHCHPRLPEHRTVPKCRCIRSEGRLRSAVAVPEALCRITRSLISSITICRRVEGDLLFDSMSGLVHGV